MERSQCFTRSMFVVVCALWWYVMYTTLLKQASINIIVLNVTVP